MTTVDAPDRTSRNVLQRLFAPRSIAVIGASTDPAKRGNHALRALRDAGYAGPVHGVNPRGGTAYGVDFVHRVADLPPAVDVALVALPARLVPGTLYELAEREIVGAVVLANGFGEAGAGGEEIDEALRRAVAETGVRVVGPNTSGIIHVASGANLVGVPHIAAGPITVLSQSGNMLLSLLADDEAVKGPGFASYVGLGNQIDVGYHECVEYFAADPATGAIAIHSEGLPDGRAFLQVLTRASRHRPVVMLRGGRSALGRQSALSHTGSVAGSDEIATAVLRQAGVELVDRSDELAVVAGVLATSIPMRDGTGVAVLSDGGGHATLAADALAAAEVPMATLSERTRARMAAVLGPMATVINPVDVAGATDADPGLFADVVDVLMDDDAVGLVLIVGLFGGYHLRFDARLGPVEHATAARLVEIAADHGVPLLVQSCYAGADVAHHDVLRDAGIQVLASIDHAVRGVAALARRGRRLATAQQRSDLIPPEPRVVDRAGDGLPVTVLDEPAARRLVEGAGIVLPPWRVVTTERDLDQALRELAVPCAVKVISPQVVHKSDAGGVALGVTVGAAAEIWRRLHADVPAAVPGAVIDGLIVTPMATRGTELLVGGTRDPVFGPVVAFGSGGVLVEALRDVSFRAAPFTEAEAGELIEETMATRLLDGYRGQPAADRGALARFLVGVGDLMIAHAGIGELDLNPVVACGADVVPLDVRIVTIDGAGTAGPPGPERGSTASRS